MGIKQKLNALIDKVCPGERNNHLWEDIFGGRPESKADAVQKAVTFRGAYEPKDELSGDWVEGPALGHGSEPGFDWRDSIPFAKEWCHKTFPED